MMELIGIWLIIEKRLIKYINNRDTDELINSIKEDIKLMMYNKKEMIV